MTRIERNKKVRRKVGVQNWLIRLLKEIVKDLILIIIGGSYAIYHLIVWFNNMIAKSFMKLPRLMKVAIIYTLVLNVFLGQFWGINKNGRIILANDKLSVEVAKNTKLEGNIATPTTCKLKKIECDIYNEAIFQGLTHEEATIVVAISKHETGNWTSKAFKERNNFGGIMCADGLKRFESYSDGKTSMIKLLKEHYFNKGLNTIEKIGAKYCPVGAKNDPKGVNKYWIPNVTKYYNEMV